MTTLIFSLGIAATILVALSTALYTYQKRFEGNCILTIAVALLLIAGFEYWWPAISVTPTSRLIGKGMNHSFILKLTNKKDYPLYQIDLRTRVEKGNLKIEDIETKPVEKPKLERKLGGLVMSFDIVGIVTMDKSGKKEYHHLIYEISPNSTKEFVVNVKAEHLKKKALISFEVVRLSREPTDVFGGKLPPSKKPK